jgi:hypothetical protein
MISQPEPVAEVILSAVAAVDRVPAGVGERTISS